MGNFYAFHQSVLGYLHEMKNIPCEDSSESDEDKNGQFYIAVVADGHGDTSCMRSADGSRQAVEIAEKYLSEFAKTMLRDKEGYQSIGEQIENGHYRDVLRPLTGTIVSQWKHWALKELKATPLTEDDLNQAGSYKDAYREGEDVLKGLKVESLTDDLNQAGSYKDAYRKVEKLLHVYGTTLLAALMLPDYLILLQQGDGRCVVFYEDGTVSEPIALDKRCHENVTTSMCDEDAHLSLLEHSTVLPLRDKRVIACWLGCDGVEDSYRNMEGTYTFYKKLLCELYNRKKTGFEAYLEKYLPEFSRMGSGDDVSVSGIVDMSCIETFVPLFSLEAEEYELKEELERFNNKLISMSRKHGLLQKQAEDTKKLYERSKDSNDWKNRLDAQKKYREAADAFSAYDGDYKKIQEQMDEIKRQLQECEKRRSLLGDEVKKNQKTKIETSRQRDFKLHNNPEAPEKLETKGKMFSGADAQSAGILNREVGNHEMIIILLILALILAFIVLLLSMRLMNTPIIIIEEQNKGVFGKVLGKIILDIMAFVN